MSNFTDKLTVGNFTNIGMPFPTDWFSPTKVNGVVSSKGLGLPQTVRVPLFDGVPIAASVSSLCGSQTLAQNANAVFKASLQVTSVAVNAAGSAYAVGDVLTATGGTHAAGQEAQYYVNQVTSGGGLVGVTILTPGLYSVAPTGVTGGNGSSGTVTITTAQTVDVLGNKIYMQDFPRTIQFVFASSPTTTLTIQGYDILNRKTSETIAVTSTSTSAVSLKAYKAIYSITSSSATSLTLFTVGANTSLGLPLSLAMPGGVNYVQTSANASGVYTIDAGTTTAGATTNPTTATSGDSLAQYAYAASLGSQQLTVWADLPYSVINCVGNEATVNPVWVFGPQPYTSF